MSPITEPNGFHILDEIFAEINVELNLVSSAKDTSYLNSDSDEDFDQEEEGNIDELNSEQLSDTELHAAQSSNTTAIKKTVAVPHKKRKVVSSQQQALSHLAASVEKLASFAAKNQRLTIEADLKRDKMLMDFKRNETQKNREHDIQMAKFLPMLLCTATDHLCYLTGQNMQMPNSKLVWESSFHNMLYFLLSPSTIHRQHPTSSLTSNNQIMMQ